MNAPTTYFEVKCIECGHNGLIPIQKRQDGPGTNVYCGKCISRLQARARKDNKARSQ